MMTEFGAGADASLGLVVLPDAAGPTGRDATKLETDELAGIVAAVCVKFPNSSRTGVETLVAAAFQHLKARATVTAHLIPLTLNRSLRLMRESTKESSRDIGAVPCSALSRRTG